MNYSIEEIESTLRERPEIADLFRLILDEPESKRGRLINKTIWIIRELEAGKSQSEIETALGIQI